MFRISAILVMLFGSWMGYGRQYPELDSLKEVLSLPITETARINTIIRYVDAAKGFESVQKLEGLVIQALEMSREAQHWKGVGSCYRELGNLQSYYNHYERALQYYLRALEIFEQINDQVNIAEVYRLIGNSYRRQNLFSEAALYLKRAIAIFQKLHDESGTASSLANMGQMYFGRGAIPLALDHFKKSLEIAERNQFQKLISDNYRYLAFAYEKLQDYQKQLQYLEISLLIEKRFRNPERLSEVYAGLGYAYINLKEFEKAEQLFKKALAIAQQIHASERERWIYRGISQLYERMGKPQVALGYYKKFYELDSLINQSLALYRIAQIQSKHELEKAEKENEKLRKNTEEQQATIRRQLIVTFAVILVLLMAMALAYVLHRKHQQGQRAKAQLEALNKELAVQKEEVLHQSRELKQAYQEIANTNANLEKIVQQRTKDLLQVNQELDMFMYRSSHDLRRPLTSLISLAQMVKLFPGDYPPDELMERILSTSYNMDKMLKKLSLIREINSEKLYLSKVDFQRLVSEVMGNTETDHVEIKVNIEPGLQLESNLRLWEAIVQNLLDNALEFARPEKPFISIAIGMKGRKVVFTIRDNGKGIDPKYHDQIFNMYFRAHEDSKGNGLGLYVVKKAVDRLGGTIYLRSEPNKYTEFEVVIPRQIPLKTPYGVANLLH